MIDTLRVSTLGNGWKRGRGWQVTSRKESIQCDEATGERETVFAKHEATGARMGGDAGGATWCEVSLPRLIHGRNDYVLKESEMPRAFERVEELLSDMHESAKILTVTRLDIAGQHPIPAAEAIWAHQLDRHPRIRKEPVRYFEESLHWIGKELHGRIYDKSKEQGRGPGNFVRMEWQMRGGILKQCITGSKKQSVLIEDLTFPRVYALYRDLCSGFTPQGIERPKGIYSFLAAGERWGWRDPAGRSPVDVYTSSKSARTGRRIRKVVASMKPELWNYDWAALLPEEPADASIVWEPTYEAA